MTGQECGGIAQLARASGSYPAGRRFKSHCRYHFFGPLVKRLRHRPFTAGSWVRFPYGSPTPPLSMGDFLGGIAQLVRALASHARGHWFDPSCLHHQFHMRMWRNRQTRMVQVHVKAISWGFKSLHPHHEKVMYEDSNSYMTFSIFCDKIERIRIVYLVGVKF